MVDSGEIKNDQDKEASMEREDEGVSGFRRVNL